MLIRSKYSRPSIFSNHDSKCAMMGPTSSDRLRLPCVRVSNVEVSPSKCEHLINGTRVKLIPHEPLSRGVVKCRAHTGGYHTTTYLGTYQAITKHPKYLCLVFRTYQSCSMYRRKPGFDSVLDTIYILSVTFGVDSPCYFSESSTIP